jgi:membrane protein DedA with SNARE-associated domain
MINDLGYVGIFIGMMIESTIFPLPSEIILIPAGALIAKGEMDFFTVFLAAVFGTILGALINFLFAMLFGRKVVNVMVHKYGKFLFITKKKLKKADDYFNKHGEITTFIGRLIPVARHLFSIPAGFSRMNIFKFIIYTALGAGLWTSILLLIGYVFWNKLEWINMHLNFLYIISLIIALTAAIIYIVLHKNHKHH